jgi:lysyl-tRNA synthetase class 1
MRDVYKSGQFDEAIRTILEHADIVRRVYKEVSHSDRPSDWYPLQVICERCGRIGTTEVYHFDGSQVSYRCRPDLVAWAKGCGHAGSMSPFGGNGKLPWKLEWTAKWHTFHVTVEGAGKDHSTKGGARDVAAACLKAIFGEEPPKNIPYEFFLVGGTKMSSSRGVGVSARDMADLLPPEALRFLMLKNPPARQVNFAPDEEQLVKLFNEYDRLRTAVVSAKADESARELFTLCLVDDADQIPEYEPPFQLLTTLLQMPHLDATTEVVKRKGTPLTPIEERSLARRVRSAQCWLDRYAREDERIRVQQVLPARALDLSHSQKAFLHRLSTALVGVPWNDDVLQATVFDVARCTPLPSAAAFEAIYRAFLDRPSGPRAGSILSCLDGRFVAERLTEMPFSLVQFWMDSSESLESFELWLSRDREQITVQDLTFDVLMTAIDTAALDRESSGLAAVSVIECRYLNKDGRPALRRALFSSKPAGSDPEAEQQRLARDARQFVSEMSQRLGADVPWKVRTRFEDLRLRRTEPQPLHSSRPGASTSA